MFYMLHEIRPQFDIEGRARAFGGFTLIELLVTVAVAAILLVVAVPGFNRLILSNRLTTSANDVIGAVNAAQAEAIKRNAPVALCGLAADFATPPGNACTTDHGAVLVMPAGSTTATIAQASVEVPSGLGLTVNSVVFAGTGQGLDPTNSNAPFNGLLADVSTPDLSSGNHRCIYMATGTVLSTCVVSSVGACPNAQPNPCN